MTCRSGRGKKFAGNVGNKLDRVGGRLADRRLWQLQQPLVRAARHQLGLVQPSSKMYGNSPDQRLPRRRLLRGIHVLQRLPARHGNRQQQRTLRRQRHGVRLGRAVRIRPGVHTHQPGSALAADANFNNTNNVLVPLKDGTNQLVAYDTGLNPLRNQWVNGPWITNLSASVYKSVPITERVKLRINLDAFNVLNQPGIGHAEHGGHHQPSQLGARRAGAAIHSAHHLVSGARPGRHALGGIWRFTYREATEPSS